MEQRLFNLNIETCSLEELRAWIVQVTSLYARAVTRFTGLDHTPTSLPSCKTNSKEHDSKNNIYENTDIITAFDNGRKIHTDSSALDRDKYDVILDLPQQALFARQNSDKHSKLERCSTDNIGATRMKLLRYMLEHPGSAIYPEMMARIGKDYDLITHNTLAASIRCLRKAIQNGNRKGPYIVTERTFGESVTYTGSVYRLNPKYHYLVIRL